MFEFKLALKYLKRNKIETLSLIACIIVVITLIVGIDIGDLSLKYNKVELAHEVGGRYNASLFTEKEDEVKKLQNNKRAYDVVTTKYLGDVIPKEGLKTSLYEFNKDYLDEFTYKLVEGRLPKEPNEIIIDATALDPKERKEILNKEISLNNLIDYEKNGSSETYSKTNKYKVVGFIKKHDQYYKIGKLYEDAEICSFVYNPNSIPPKELIRYRSLFNIKKYRIGDSIFGLLTEIKKEIKIDESKENRIYIRTDIAPGLSVNSILSSTMDDATGKYDFAEKAEDSIYILIISIFIIINIVNNIINKMIRDIGQLRIIGMSNKKIIKFYTIQTLIIFVLGALIGFGCSIIYAKFAMSTIDVFKSAVYVENFNNVKIVIQYKNVIKYLIIIFATLCCSTAIIGFKTLKYSPIEIINKTDKIKYKVKNNKNLIFTLLKSTIFRNKFKLIMVVAIIFLCGKTSLHLISTSDDYLDEQIDQIQGYVDQYSNIIRTPLYGSEDTKKLEYNSLKKIEQLQGVNNFKVINYSPSYLKIKKSKLHKDLSKRYITSNPNSNFQEYSILLDGLYNNQNLDKFKISGNLNELKEGNENYINIAVANNFYNNNSNSSKNMYDTAIKDLKIGDILKVKVKDASKNYEYKTVKCRVAVILSDAYQRNNSLNFSGHTLRICMDMNNYKEVVGNNYSQKVFFNISKENNNKTNDFLQKLKDKNSFLDIYNKYDEEKFKLTYEHIIAFLIMIAALLNLYITIQLNFKNNLREFSILRSLGLKKKILGKIVIYESLLYSFLGSSLAIIDLAVDELKYRSYLIDMYIDLGLKVKPYFPKEGIIFLIVFILLGFIIGYIKSKELDKLDLIKGIKEN